MPHFFFEKKDGGDQITADIKKDVDPNKSTSKYFEASME